MLLFLSRMILNPFCTFVGLCSLVILGCCLGLCRLGCLRLGLVIFAVLGHLMICFVTVPVTV